MIATQYPNGKNDMVKVFNQKCVICLERDSIYEFRQRGHQRVCEQSYQNEGDIDILNVSFVENNNIILSPKNSQATSYIRNQ